MKDPLLNPLKIPKVNADVHPNDGGIGQKVYLLSTSGVLQVGLLDILASVPA